MKFLQKISLTWVLRLGLGIMYLYSGYDLVANPQHWYGFVPKWLSQTLTPTLSVTAYLKLQGIGELIIGILFLAWFFGKWGLRLAALLAAVEMALILIFVGIDPITFRDIGLLGAALALLISSWKKEDGQPIS